MIPPLFNFLDKLLQGLALENRLECKRNLLIHHRAESAVSLRAVGVSSPLRDLKGVIHTKALCRPVLHCLLLMGTHRFGSLSLSRCPCLLQPGPIPDRSRNGFESVLTLEGANDLTGVPASGGVGGAAGWANCMQDNKNTWSKLYGHCNGHISFFHFRLAVQCTMCQDCIIQSLSHHPQALLSSRHGKKVRGTLIRDLGDSGEMALL
jgi:hypothetical protein